MPSLSAPATYPFSRNRLRQVRRVVFAGGATRKPTGPRRLRRFPQITSAAPFSAPATYPFSRNRLQQFRRVIFAGGATRKPIGPRRLRRFSQITSAAPFSAPATYPFSRNCLRQVRRVVFAGGATRKPTGPRRPVRRITAAGRSANLPLRVLRTTTGFAAPDLLALDFACVARHKTSITQRLA